VADAVTCIKPVVALTTIECLGTESKLKSNALQGGELKCPDLMGTSAAVHHIKAIFTVYHLL